MTTDSKPRVLIVGTTELAYKKFEELKNIVHFIECEQPSHDEAPEYFTKIADEHGPFIACVISAKLGKPSPYPLTKEIFAPLVKAGCKMFAGPGAGYDKVDVDYLTKNGAYWANSPNSVGQRTADSTAMLILMALRGTSEQERSMRAGKWMDMKVLSRDARSCTLGIIGMGNIGKMVANHLQHFGMKVVYSKRTPLPADEENGCRFVSLDELFQVSDVVCVMCPLTPETKHLLSAKEFAKMKDNVIIVNSARGPIIDTEAMLDALDSGKVLRAALDVHEGEPDKVSSRLLAHPRTTLTPHSAWITDTLILDSQTELLSNLESFIITGKPNTPVNVPIKA